MSTADIKGPLSYIARRLATSVLTIVGLASIVFVMVKLMPGDQARVAAGQYASSEQVAQMRESLGLNESLPVQYVRYMGRLLQGDLGTSATTQRQVANDILNSLPDTLQLVILAMLVGLLVSFPAATIAAAFRGRSLDTISRVSVIMIAGLPVFWLGLMLQWLLGTRLGLAPISGNLSIGVHVPHQTGMTLIDSLLAGNLYAFSDAAQHLALPALVLAVPLTAQLYRALRTEMLSVLEREHISVARAKGVGSGRLLRRHALPNSVSPALTIVGVEFGILISSAILVESVFALPGAGSYLVNAVQQRDTTAILGTVIVFGIFVVVANFVVDLIQLIRDPRLRAAEIGG